MKGDNPYIMRALYIILVPLVLLLILLNSGWLQRLLPAASVHGESYSVVRYNFYYFDYYRTFLEENEDQMAELGFDPQGREGEQIRSDGQTWKEYFQTQAEAMLSQTEYYCTLAQAAGYSFSEEDLAPVAAQMERQAEEYSLFGVSANNYYTSYYGSGMDAEAYRTELTRKVQAEVYKARLIAQAQADEDEIVRWMEDHPAQDYRTADLRVITLDALPERGTGEVGGEQLAALSSKLARLEERYENGTPFAQLQAAFSTNALGDETGLLTGATAEQLPEVLADWCLWDQAARREGDACAVVDQETGTAYFAVLDGLGGSARERAAQEAVSKQQIEAQEAEALADYTVKRNRFGMLLATA